MSLITNVYDSIKQKDQVPIFYKASGKSSNEMLVQKFSKEALSVFSDRARKAFQKGEKSLTISNVDKKSFCEILAWIMMCISETKAVFFQTVSLLAHLNLT
jgi:hypothetical protein